MLKILVQIINVVIDSIFPLSKEEYALKELSPESAFGSLPPAPDAPIPGVISIFAYKKEIVRKLVWSIKYGKNFHCAEIGGYALWRVLQEIKNEMKNEILVAPIPISKRRRSERGFNQCELLTSYIRKFDVKKEFHYEDFLLVRTKHTDKQTLKDRKGRLKSAINLFSVNENIKIQKELTVFIIDDVITTGSTIKEAIETLKKAGYKNVYGLSLAH